MADYRAIMTLVLQGRSYRDVVAAVGCSHRDVAAARKVNLKIMKTAIAYGTIVASFTVEKFGLERLREVKREHFDKRLEVLKKICKI